MTRKTFFTLAAIALLLAVTRKPDAPARPPEVPPAGDSSSVTPAAARRVDEWTITVHQAPFHCPPCNRLKPELVKLRDAGWIVNVITGEASSYPTIIMRCGEREHKRASGYVDAVTIADWPKMSEANQSSSSSTGRRSFRLGCWSCR